MFIDASAMVALMALEPDHRQLQTRLEGSPGPHRVSAIAMFEATLAIARILTAPNARITADAMYKARAMVNAFVDDLEAQVIPLTEAVGVAAVDACARYGKVVGHPAQLNLGDCFAYACARAEGLPLLYKGDDFAHTDLA